MVEHDIAVLKVASPEQLPCQQRRIWPACLPDKVRNITQPLMMVLRISARVLELSFWGQSVQVAGLRGLVTGWGKQQDGGDWSPQLRKVNTQHIVILINIYIFLL